MFSIAKIWMPLNDEWIKKMWYVCTRNTIKPKENEILPFATAWMILEGVMLSEKVRQRKTNTISSHLYMESKKTNKQNKTKQNPPPPAKNQAHG